MAGRCNVNNPWLVTASQLLAFSSVGKRDEVQSEVKSLQDQGPSVLIHTKTRWLKNCKCGTRELIPLAWSLINDRQGIDENHQWPSLLSFLGRTILRQCVSTGPDWRSPVWPNTWLHICMEPWLAHRYTHPFVFAFYLLPCSPHISLSLTRLNRSSR